MLPKQISTSMKEHYQSAFYGVVKETQEQTGYTLPVEIESYVVMLLADKIDKTNFLPENSFAESYLQLTNSRDAKSLGDNCLFVTGVFPNYGLDSNYYISIGQSSYLRISQGMNKELFDSLSKHFIFIRDFIELSTTPPKLQSLDFF